MNLMKAFQPFVHSFLMTSALFFGCVELSASSACDDDSCHSGVYASFQAEYYVQYIVDRGDNFPFNVEKVNKGCGIEYDEVRNEFVVRKAGYYQINYGANTVAANPFVRGMDLVHVKNGCEKIRDTTSVGHPSSTVAYLACNDRIKIVAQQNSQLVWGSLTTSHVNTSFITFVLLKCCD